MLCTSSCSARAFLVASAPWARHLRAHKSLIDNGIGSGCASSTRKRFLAIPVQNRSGMLQLHSAQVPLHEGSQAQPARASDSALQPSAARDLGANSAHHGVSLSALVGNRLREALWKGDGEQLMNMGGSICLFPDGWQTSMAQRRRAVPRR